MSEKVLGKHYDTGSSAEKPEHGETTLGQLVSILTFRYAINTEGDTIERRKKLRTALHIEHL